MDTPRAPKSTEEYNLEQLADAIRGGETDRRNSETSFFSTFNPQGPRASECHFFDMNARECAKALAYYYEHPDELPERRKEQDRRIEKPTREVLVDFNQGIFGRQAIRQSGAQPDAEPLSPTTPSAPLKPTGTEDGHKAASEAAQSQIARAMGEARL